jgi:hypothetical protein
MANKGRTRGRDDAQSARSGNDARADASLIKLGLVCAPEMPEKIGHELASELPKLLSRYVDHSVSWDVSVVVDPLTGSEQDAPEILDVCHERLRREGWDLAVCLTDLPVYRSGRLLARSHGAEVLDAREHDDVPETIREMTDGRGPDSVIDAVGMEAHGSPVGKLGQRLAGLLPDSLAQRLMQKAGTDRLSVFYSAIDTVRRGGTISLIGVYGGMADPLPMLTLFDKQIQLRMGQANVKRWVDDLMPLVTDDADLLGIEGFATHRLPLEQAPHGYEIFQKKQDGAIKVLLQP